MNLTGKTMEVKFNFVTKVLLLFETKLIESAYGNHLSYLVIDETTNTLFTDKNKKNISINIFGLKRPLYFIG